MADEIIKELWTIKDAMAQEYRCDVKSLVADMRAKKRVEDRQIIDLRSIKQAAQRRAEADPNHAEVR
jgi:hypothetical protein